VDTLKDRGMFAGRQVVEPVKPPQRLVHPGVADTGLINTGLDGPVRFVFHAPNATVC